jgi:hypothetical protein
MRWRQVLSLALELGSVHFLLCVREEPAARISRVGDEDYAHRAHTQERKREGQAYLVVTTSHSWKGEHHLR